MILEVGDIVGCQSVVFLHGNNQIYDVVSLRIEDDFKVSAGVLEKGSLA